jgi:hypothetical protein
VISERTKCNTFQLTMDQNSSASASSLACPSGVLTVKKPLPLNELILTATTATGTFITDIYAQAVYSCREKAKSSDFGQTGCSVDLTVGYTHFAFDCTGGTNVQTVVLPLTSPVQEHAFLSVVVHVADTCGSPLSVDQLTIEGHRVPTAEKGCPDTPSPVSCNQAWPRYSRITIPQNCRQQF